MKLIRAAAFVLTSVLLPVLAAAQSTSGAIAGTVKDATGAVLPGVTVEAASPALIEKVRTVTTDSEGNYRIVDLRPGTYTVTFTLTGFATFKREGLELTTGFTANVNADMKVGEVSEAVTVTGETPVVDIQNTRVQTVLTREILDSAPTARKDFYSFAALTLGTTVGQGTGQDVGGNQTGVAGSQAYHGVNAADARQKIDGMDYNSFNGNGGGSVWLYQRPNQQAMSEVNLGLGAQGAEFETGGVQTNFVPKDGGNRLTLTGSVAYGNDHFQGTNLTDQIKARGLNSVEAVQRALEVGFGVGGPIARDRLWFFVAPEWTRTDKTLPGSYYNKTQHTPFYTPDLNNPAISKVRMDDFASRLTWQASGKDKITGSFNRETACLCTFAGSPTVAPEFVGSYYFYNDLAQVTWTRPQTSKLLFQGGLSYGYFQLSLQPTGDVQPTDISTIDIATGTVYGSVAGSGFSSAQGALYSATSDCCHSDPLVGRLSASYVTGSHAFKVGYGLRQGWHNWSVRINQSLQYLFLGRTPIALMQFADPFNEQLRITEHALYAQDQWTMRRLTLNLGARFDTFNSRVLAQNIAAGRFVPARSFPEVDDVPDWKDIVPRIGAAYDVFGNGKTAIKASFGKYVVSMGAGVAEQNNPALRAVTVATRTWFDGNGNYVPDCDLTNFNPNGECGAISNRLFGQTAPGTTFSNDTLSGWGARTYTWQTAVSLQQELRPGISATVGYFHNAYGNIWVSQNTAISANDVTYFCVTAPTDPRLPGGGGNQVCGNYDVNPAKFGQVNTVIQRSSDLGANVTRVYNGVDAGVNGRFGHGGYVAGGVSIGRTVLDDCALNTIPSAIPVGVGWLEQNDVLGGRTHPSSTPYCHVAPPWNEAYQVKINGVYPLPYGFEVGAVYQNLPGAQVNASRGADACLIATCLTYTNAQIAPIIGRNLSAGAAGTVTIPIVAPQTMFEDRLNQFDLRIAKVLKLDRTRTKLTLDIYNLFNASAITGSNPTFGPTYLNVTQVMGARFMKIGAQFDF
jgi:hypothetical protein